MCCGFDAVSDGVTFLLCHARVCRDWRGLCLQAGVAARKPYIWAIDSTSDAAGGMLFARLLTVIDGCVSPEPTRRLTVPAVLKSLTTLQRDVAAAVPTSGSGSRFGSVAGGGGGAAASPVAVPPPPVAATPMYDVLAIVSAMEALKIDATAVIDAIGGVTASSLNPLRRAGVPFAKCIAVRDALASGGGAPAPAKVKFSRGA